jgi:hypothetical protein
MESWSSSAMSRASNHQEGHPWTNASTTNGSGESAKQVTRIQFMEVGSRRDRTENREHLALAGLTLLLNNHFLVVE